MILKSGSILRREPLDDLAAARVLHIPVIIRWIGGVSLVTAVILPAVAQVSEPSRRIAVSEEIEGRFSFQAEISVTLAGLSGFSMTRGWPPSPRVEIGLRFMEQFAV